MVGYLGACSNFYEVHKNDPIHLLNNLIRNRSIASLIVAVAHTACTVGLTAMVSSYIYSCSSLALKAAADTITFRSLTFVPTLLTNVALAYLAFKAFRFFASLTIAPIYEDMIYDEISQTHSYTTIDYTDPRPIALFLSEDRGRERLTEGMLPYRQLLRSHQVVFLSKEQDEPITILNALQQIPPNRIGMIWFQDALIELTDAAANDDLPLNLLPQFPPQTRIFVFYPRLPNELSQWMINRLQSVATTTHAQVMAIETIDAEKSYVSVEQDGVHYRNRNGQETGVLFV
jgi:hypothetical protein